MRDRMVYAASSAALKDGLGQSNFDAATYSISLPSEASAVEYTATSRSMSQDELLTLDEKEKLDGETQSALAMGSTRTRAIVGLPIKASEDALTQLAAVQKGSPVSTVILLLNSESEVLEVQTAGNFTFEQVQGMLPLDQPRYVLQNFAHQHEGKQTNAYVFCYYCPDDCKPKVRRHSKRFSPLFPPFPLCCFLTLSFSFCCMLLSFFSLLLLLFFFFFSS